MYANGKGVPQDYDQTVKWYQLAANQGYAMAQSNLGVAYAKGNGVPQDYAQAVKWYQLAANQRNATGQNDLGLMYASGQGVPQDYVLAYMWFNLAAAQGEAAALKNRDATAAHLTPDKLLEAQKLARDWKPTPSAGR